MGGDGEITETEVFVGLYSCVNVQSASRHSPMRPYPHPGSKYWYIQLRRESWLQCHSYAHCGSKARAWHFYLMEVYPGFVGFGRMGWKDLSDRFSLRTEYAR